MSINAKKNPYLAAAGKIAKPSIVRRKDSPINELAKYSTLVQKHEVNPEYSRTLYGGRVKKLLFETRWYLASVNNKFDYWQDIENLLALWYKKKYEQVIHHGGTSQYDISYQAGRVEHRIEVKSKKTKLLQADVDKDFPLRKLAPGDILKFHSTPAQLASLKETPTHKGTIVYVDYTICKSRLFMRAYIIEKASIFNVADQEKKELSERRIKQAKAATARARRLRGADTGGVVRIYEAML